MILIIEFFYKTSKINRITKMTKILKIANKPASKREQSQGHLNYAERK